MGVRDLTHLFEPGSIAVIGASNQRTGRIIMRNLLTGGFSGPIMPVNPKYESVTGVLCYPNVSSLPVTPDLAVICTPPQAVPEVIEELGGRGTRAAMIISGGLHAHVDAAGRNLRDVALEAATRAGLRVLGTNTMGLLVPRLGLNASFSHVAALPGKIAFVSQSSALCATVLDWALPRGIGFSHFVSLGDGLDVDFGDVLDYLASDPGTQAILLYIESISERRNFVAAARAAARNKPVVAIKAGRDLQMRGAGMTQSALLAGPDKVFDAVLRRAGILRVQHIDELFAAAETLSRARSIKGERLAVLANGGGAGVIVKDELMAGDLRPAALAKDTFTALDAALPDTWSRSNPIDINLDASGDRYTAALNVLMQAQEVDAALVMHAPTALVDSQDVAQAVIKTAKETRGTGRLLTSWIGAGTVADARRLFAEAGIATYDTPRSAVSAFLHLVNHGRNREMLMETPPSWPVEFRPAADLARRLVDEALDDGVMAEPRAMELLAAYGIPGVRLMTAAGPAEAAAVAKNLGFPVALTIHSPDIGRKRDVGGISLYLDNAEAVGSAASRMIAHVRDIRPDAHINGFIVQRMVPRPNARQLLLGMTVDPLFGPVIVFGEGGRAVELGREHTVGLPPLNMPLARDLISRGRIWNLLQPSHARPQADLEAICLTLVKISQLIVDIPEIIELDINPLFADDKGVTAAGVHIRLARPGSRVPLSIQPYPKGLEETWRLRDGREVLVRPIRPEDEPQHQDLLARLSPEDLRARFFMNVRHMEHSQMARFTQIDYDREMAFVAVTQEPEQVPETLGVVRVIVDPDNQEAEFAVLVRSDLKGQGLGHQLMQKIISYCRSRGTKMLSGEVLSTNNDMLRLAQRLGMEVAPGPGQEAYVVKMALT